MSATAKNPVLWAASPIPWWVAIAYALVCLFSFGALTSGGTPLDAPVLGIGVVLFVLSALPRRIEVGAEGLRIAWIGVRTLRYDRIARAAPHGDTDVMVTLKSGSHLRLLKSPFRSDSPRAVLERLWSTVSFGAEERLADAERAILERGNRDLPEWAEALSQIARAGGQYRVGMPLEKLWRVVENPAIDSELRAAAAVTLVNALDDVSRTRLEEIAESTVDEPLRAALGRVAHAREVADLTGALAELGGAAPRSREA